MKQHEEITLHGFTRIKTESATEFDYILDPLINGTNSIVLLYAISKVLMADSQRTKQNIPNNSFEVSKAGSAYPEGTIIIHGNNGLVMEIITFCYKYTNIPEGRIQLNTEQIRELESAFSISTKDRLSVSNSCAKLCITNSELNAMQSRPSAFTQTPPNAKRDALEAELYLVSCNIEVEYANMLDILKACEPQYNTLYPKPMPSFDACYDISNDTMMAAYRYGVFSEEDKGISLSRFKKTDGKNGTRLWAYHDLSTLEIDNLQRMQMVSLQERMQVLENYIQAVGAFVVPQEHISLVDEFKTKIKEQSIRINKRQNIPKGLDESYWANAVEFPMTDDLSNCLLTMIKHLRMDINVYVESPQNPDIDYKVMFSRYLQDHIDRGVNKDDIQRMETILDHISQYLDFTFSTFNCKGVYVAILNSLKNYLLRTVQIPEKSSFELVIQDLYDQMATIVINLLRNTQNNIQHNYDKDADTIIKIMKVLHKNSHQFDEDRMLGLCAYKMYNSLIEVKLTDVSSDILMKLSVSNPKVYAAYLVERYRALVLSIPGNNAVHEEFVNLLNHKCIVENSKHWYTVSTMFIYCHNPSPLRPKLNDGVYGHCQFRTNEEILYKLYNPIVVLTEEDLINTNTTRCCADASPGVSISHEELFWSKIGLLKAFNPTDIIGIGRRSSN